MMIISISLYSFDGLFIDFCIPKHIHKKYTQKNCSLTLRFQKSILVILIKN